MRTCKLHCHVCLQRYVHAEPGHQGKIGCSHQMFLSPQLVVCQRTDKAVKSVEELLFLRSYVSCGSIPVCPLSPVDFSLGPPSTSSGTPPSPSPSGTTEHQLGNRISCSCLLTPLRGFACVLGTIFCTITPASLCFCGYPAERKHLKTVTPCRQFPPPHHLHSPIRVIRVIRG